MERERLPVGPGDEDRRGADRVAERLEQLTSDEVERILARAIDLQAESSVDQAGLVDSAALGRIAAELGIEERHLREAMVEELIRLETDDPTLLDRLIAPDSIAASATIDGDRVTIREALDDWLGRSEGLRKHGETASGALWRSDRRLGTRLRMRLSGGGGDGVLRSAASVRDSVRPVTDTRNVVTVEADTSNVRRVAVTLLVASLGAGAVAAGLLGAANGAGVGAAEVATGLGTLGLLAGGVWLGVRMWADRIARGLERTLHAVARPRGAHHKSGILGVIDDVIELTGEIRTALVFGRKRS